MCYTCAWYDVCVIHVHGMMCYTCAWYDVCVKLLVFILISWMGVLMFSIKLGKFSVIISSNIFLLLSLFSFRYSHFVNIGVFNGISHFFEAVFYSILQIG